MFTNFFRFIRLERHYLFLYFGIIVLVVGTINYSVLVRSQSRIIEHEALRIAEVASTQAIISRDIFTTTVADKLQKDGFGITEDFSAHKGFVPIPSQFLKFVAEGARSRNDGLYRYTVLSKWNLAPTQGLKDDFERWAWMELEKQDQASPSKPIPWKPVWRYEIKEGERTLRYMRADPASDNTCLTCHNEFENRKQTIENRIAAGIKPGKQWQLHQLMGAIEVEVPIGMIEGIASKQAKVTLIIVLLTSFAGIGVAALLAWHDLKQEKATALFFKQQANLDRLTGLPNRTAFEINGRAAIQQAKKTSTKVGILFVDLDGFKPINDNFGHQAGDFILKAVSQRFKKTTRDADLVVRQGGDEFLVLLQGVNDEQNFSAVAQKLVDSLKVPFEIQGKEVSVSASIGISHYPKHGADLTVLIAKADAAMYTAKHSGKNTWCEWKPESKQV